MQKYLESDMLTKREKLLVFSLRAHMIKVGHNYGNKQICPLCQDPDTDDSQTHLINCEVLKEECQDIKNKIVVYSDLYSDDISIVKEIAKLFKIALRKREELLEKRREQQVLVNRLVWTVIIYY